MWSPSIVLVFIAWISLPLATLANAVLVYISRTTVMMSSSHAAFPLSTMMAPASIADIFFPQPNLPLLSSALFLASLDSSSAETSSMPVLMHLSRNIVPYEFRFVSSFFPSFQLTTRSRVSTRHCDILFGPLPLLVPQLSICSTSRVGIWLLPVTACLSLGHRNWLRVHSSFYWQVSYPFVRLAYWRYFILIVPVIPGEKITSKHFRHFGNGIYILPLPVSHHLNSCSRSRVGEVYCPPLFAPKWVLHVVIPYPAVGLLTWLLQFCIRVRCCL